MTMPAHILDVLCNCRWIFNAFCFRHKIPDLIILAYAFSCLLRLACLPFPYKEVYCVLCGMDGLEKSFSGHVTAFRYKFQS
ncbi:hypothetical protein RIF29_31013 [Crotalaria pallida]|uniref:Uncharacterized protein n=1 Tax=Crotalaria pallida TaxID=3830 RepID=A0AAN9EHI8_CROPI